MRIGLVSHEYPPQQGLGGVGTYTFRLAGALGAAGHDVHVITGPSTLAPIPQPNVTLHRIPAEFDLDEAPRTIRWLFWQGIAGPISRANPTLWHWLRWDLATHKAIQTIDERYPFDVIEAPEHAGNGLMAGMLHRWPLIVRVHCPWELFARINRVGASPMNRLMSLLERRTVARHADAITVPSRAMRRQLEGSWKLRRPVKVVPNFMDVPADPAPLPPDDGDEPLRIVCTGRIEPLKSQQTLAAAFALIAARHPRAELWLIGPDRWSERCSFADLLRRLIPDERVRRRIHLPGLVSLSDITEHLRNARVAVVASVGFESFSFSALEAMSAARPTVVTSTGALPELIDHEQQGLIVSPGDAHEMASAIDRFLSDRDLSERCGRAAHQRALARYDTPRVLPEILKVYAQAADFYFGNRRLPARISEVENASAIRSLLSTPLGLPAFRERLVTS